MRRGSSLEVLLAFGGIVLVGVAIGMLIAPSGVASIFGLELGAGGEFMTRRYGAAGMVGLGVASWSATRMAAAPAVLVGLAGWFFVQGSVVIVALAAGTVADIAVVAAVSDPLLGAAALALAARSHRTAASSTS